MKYITTQTIRRLATGTGHPVIFLSTEFGGGKTHTLLLLYHLFTNPAKGFDYLQSKEIHKDLSIHSVPEARIVSIDCRRLDPLSITLWGEIARQLKLYDTVKKYDEEKIVPNIDIITKMVDKPVLILIDELPNYVFNAGAKEVGNKKLSELTISFIENLNAAISSTKNSQLIITLTGDQPIYRQEVASLLKIKGTITDEEKSRLMGLLRESASRHAHYITPIERQDIYDIIRTRLISRINEVERDSIIAKFMEYYSRRLSTDLSYRDKMKKSYPFHPELIDILYERVSTIYSFNKTRGVLRLLALTLKHIFSQRSEDAFFIMAHHIPLDEYDVKTQLTDALGKENYKQVVETDILDRARKFDTHKTQKFHEKIAKVIFLYSLIGAVRASGATYSDIKLSVCIPGDDNTYVEQVLRDLEEKLWYINSANQQYYFDTEPNIYAIIDDYKREITSEDQYRQEINKVITGLLFDREREKKDWNFKVWDVGSIGDTYDSNEVFVVDYNLPGNREKKPQLILDLTYNNTNGTPRSYPNSLYFLYADEHLVKEVKEMAKSIVACLNARKDERIHIDSTKVRKIDKKLSEEKRDLEIYVRKCYCYVAYPYKGDLRVEPISEYESNDNLSDIVVFKTLKNIARKAVSLYEIDFLVNEIIKFGDQPYLKIDDILKRIKETRRFAVPIENNNLLTSINQAVENGFLGYSSERNEIDGKFVAIISEEVSLSWQGYVINKNFVYQTKLTEPSVVAQEGEDHSTFPLPSRRLELKDRSDLSNLDNIKNIIEMRIETEGNNDQIVEILKRVSIIKKLIGIQDLKIELSLQREDKVLRMIGGVILSELPHFASAINDLLSIYERGHMIIAWSTSKKDGVVLKEFIEPLLQNNTRLEVIYANA